MSNTIGTVLIDVKADTAKLVSGMEKAQSVMTKSVGNMTSALKGLAAAYISFESVKGFVTTGLEYNRMMEQQIIGMQRMIVATSQDVSAKGKQLSLTEKYIMAADEAKTTMAELEAINAQTPHTLGQTVQIYNAMYASMKNAGASSEEMIQLTKEISMATSNMDFGAVLSGVDGLATGTVEASSDFGRFMSSLGLTNEELKNSENVIELVHEKLGQMTLSADSMDEATSNLTNSFEKFAGKANEPLFDLIKEDIKSMSKAMDESNQTLLDFVYFLSLPVAGAHLLVNAFRVAFNTIPIYFEDAGLAIKEYWIKLLFELQKSARDVLPEKMAGMLGFDAKSIKDNKSALSAISGDRSKLAAQVIKEQELLSKTASAYYNINVSTPKSAGKKDGLVANPRGETEEQKKAREEAEKKAADVAKKAQKEAERIADEQARFNDRANEYAFQQAVEHHQKQKKEKQQANEDYIRSSEEMYRALNDMSGNWYDNEIVNISNRAAEFAKAGMDNNEIINYVNQSINAIDTKVIKEAEDSLKKMEDDTIKLNTVFEDAFKSMEDSMVDMFMTGKIKADDFFNTIIEGIIRMQIRNSITEPLTKAVSGVDFGGMFSSAGSSIMSWFASANGNAFNHGAPVYAFANGGAFTNSVVSQPTMAPMSLFGEAGPEAIMPLTRIGSSLGVKATPSNVVVNIQNNSGVPVSEDNVQTSFDAGTMVVNVVLDAITRNKGGLRDSIRGVR